MEWKLETFKDEHCLLKMTVWAIRVVESQRRFPDDQKTHKKWIETLFPRSFFNSIYILSLTEAIINAWYLLDSNFRPNKVFLTNNNILLVSTIVVRALYLPRHRLGFGRVTQQPSHVRIVTQFLMLHSKNLSSLPTCTRKYCIA